MIFEITQVYLRGWNRNSIKWNTTNKNIVRDFITNEIYQKSFKVPKGFKTKLTRINWKYAYLNTKDNNLIISASISFIHRYQIDYLKNPKWNYLYHSDRLEFEIPINDLTSYQRNNLLNQLI